MTNDATAPAQPASLLGLGSSEGLGLAEESRACARHCKEGAWSPNVLQNEQGVRLKSAQVLEAAADEIDRLNALRRELQAERETLLDRIARSGGKARSEERDRCKARAVQIVEWHRNDYNSQQIDPIVAELRNGL